MYCPKCGVEYREGFTECSDCRVRLTSKKPAEPKALGNEFKHEHAGNDGGLELVTVMTSDSPVLFASAKGLLDDAGIPFIAPEGEVRHPSRWWTIQVAADRQQEARELLQIFEEGGAVSG